MDVEIVEPHLVALEVRIFDAPIGPMLWIEGVASEGIQENQATSLALETSAGSSAEIRLPRSICGEPSNWRICRQLSVAMKPGRQTRELDDFLANLDAGFVATYDVAGSAAGVVEIFSGSMATVGDLVRSHRAVEVAESTTTGSPGWDLSYAPQRYLRVVVPTQECDPTPTSAELRLLRGDTITIRYRQPDGSELTARTVFSVH